MGVSEWVAFLSALVRFGLILFEKMHKTPNEKRREALADFDKAIEKAETTKDLRDLSNFLGKKL